MTDRPILFSGPMVRALLAGTKTQTRRVITPRRGTKAMVDLFDGSWTDEYVLDPGNQSWREDSYPWGVGDRLYVREAWRTGLAYEDLSLSDMGGEEQVLFESDGTTERWTKNSTEPGRLRPGMHMPRWASRLTLLVTDVRVQRLQDISEEDSKAEGMTGEFCDFELYGQSQPYRYEYCGLWDHLNKARGYGWETNPWVVAVGFVVVYCNIDEAAK